MAKKNRLGISQQIKNLERSDRLLMFKLANNSKNFFQVKNWEAQGFIDGGVRKWAPVKNKPPGQKILVRTGRLRRSARFQVLSPRKAEVSFNTNYATFVNDKRQFIGRSKTLEKENRLIIQRHLKKVMKK